MTPALALLTKEAQRRDTIKRAILAKYEFTGDKRDRIRRRDVYVYLSDLMGKGEWNPHWCREVTRHMRALGADMVKPNNVKMYRRVRERRTDNAGSIPAR